MIRAQSSRSRGPAAAWIAVRGSLDPRILWLTAGVTFWTAGFDVIYSWYPPLEHGATMLSGVLIGVAFLNYLLQNDRFTRGFFAIGTALAGILSLVTAIA